MYYVLVREISSGKIVDKVELSLNQNIAGELAHLALATRKQCENKYPADKYFITYEEAPGYDELLAKLALTDSSQNKNQNTFKMHASGYYLMIVNVSGFVLGAALLFLLLVIRVLYNPFLFIVGMMLIGFYLLFDYKKWMKKGIQLVEINTEGINIFRGSEMILSRIDKKQITGINVFKKIKRRIVNILLGGYADSSLPGVTLFSGPRIRITDDAFSEAEFGIFIEKLRELKPDIYF